jgi:hypothetical protein
MKRFGWVLQSASPSLKLGVNESSCDRKCIESDSDLSHPAQRFLRLALDLVIRAVVSHRLERFLTVF